jgi:3-oxoacid CoA-transferase B subunit
VTAEQRITFHSENGLLGFGPLTDAEDADPDLYNASGQLVGVLPGASFFDSAAAFAMARSGRVGTIVLGGFQVAANGDLANWNVPASGVGGIGGAMDLVAGDARLIVLMFHATRDGAPKLVERCTYPLTAARRVATIVTDLALIDVTNDGFLLRELAPGIGLEEVRAVTGASLQTAPDLREMEFT